MKKTMLVAVTALAVLFTLAAVTVASESPIHPIDKSQEACIEKDWSTAGMTNCTYKAQDQWDKELNKNYSTLLKELNPEEKEVLKTAQKKWLEYRDNEFKLIDAVYARLHGTMYIPMRASERLDIVKQRALTLKGYLDQLREAK